MPEGQGQSSQRSVGLNYFSELWITLYSDNRNRHLKNQSLIPQRAEQLTVGLGRNWHAASGTSSQRPWKSPDKEGA